MNAVAISGGFAVLAGGLSGYSIAGVFGGLVVAVVSCLALAVSIVGNNRARRREYEQEIQESYDRGQSSMKAELDNARREADRAWREAESWRGKALGRRRDGTQ